MSFPSSRTVLATLIAGLAASTAAAQETARLDDVVVTAAGYEQQVQDAPASISVITREELEGRAYRDITDALRNVPGVTVTGGGSSQDISIRGMGAKYTLLLVDGKRQGSRETRPNSDGPGIEQGWMPPLSAIERIEVIRGPMSSLYGSDALGGVINVITRKVPQEWGGEVSTGMTLQQDSASGDEHNSRFYVAGPLVAERLGLQVYGQYDQRDEDAIIGGYADQRLASGTAKLTWTPDDINEIGLEAGYSEQRRITNPGESVALVGRRGPNERSEQKYDRRHFALSHDGYFDFGSTESYVQHEEVDNPSRDMNYRSTVADTKAVLPLGAHILTLGGQYEKQRLEDGGNESATSSLSELERYRWALYAEDEWMLTEDVSLTGGVRLNEDEQYGSHWSPRLYGVWHLDDRWTLKGGVSSGFRAPDLRATNADWVQVSRGGNIYGNPDLEAETSLSQELGLHYAADNGLLAGLTVFHTDFEDKITRVACPTSVCTEGANQFGSDPTYRLNVDEAVTRGVEFSLSTPLADNLDLSTSYTYTDSEQKTGEYKGEPLNQLPKHQVTASLDWQATERLSQWTRLTYRGEESQPTTGPSRDAIVAPSYTFVDAGLGYQLTPQTTLNAGLYNLFDEDITEEEYGYVEDGRRLWLGINVEF
ncbi:MULTISPECIES: ligand-gated channel protein [Halomonas]|uniref:Iron-regulated outer membrane virulence protein n=1 Tax=Halomonas halophila TaxID=29573 RepID=A0ABQ0U5R0_9GAMM|nr:MULTISPECIES: ligand-gated channel protein [Halomonas]MDR5890333.1 ligand-gated channel protein [Halomonas salina]WJY08175.1 ligand-gated channel protein [Halomonas halophila]GEK73781.1 iron-regulated outer membrane virulence protein [Halomonas halophila]